MKLQDIYDEIITSVNAEEADSEAFIKLLTTIFAENDAAYRKGLESSTVITALKDAVYEQDISVKECFNVIYWGYVSLCKWLDGVNVSADLFLCALCMHIESKIKIPMFTSVLKEAVNDFGDSSAAANYIYCSIGNVYRALYD